MHVVEPARRPQRQAPGQMTSVMRALSLATGPKVIRVGVVRNGRVIEERIIKQRITVTVGSSETAMFVIPQADVPSSIDLFERVGDDYYLNVLEGMKGRVALASGISDLPEVPRGGRHRVKLTDDARGKVVVGATTLLFQFVAPPPVQPRPQLPLGVKGGLATKNDWALTVIVAFSFLVHFGLVGGMYSDWSDPIVGDRYDVAGLIDMMGPVRPPPPVEVPEDSTAAAATPTSATPAPRTPAPKQPNAANVKEPSQSAQPPGTISNERSAVLAARAEEMQVAILAGVNGGPAVERALRRSNVPGVDLSTAAERNVGIAQGNSELKTTGGGPVQASNPGGLGKLAITKTDGSTVAGRETNTAGPTAVAQVGIPTASVAIPGAESVVAGLRGRFRSCYQTGLLGDPNMSGKVLVSAKIGPNGEVTSADIAQISGLSPAVGQCIAGVVKRATFGAPGATGSTIQIPVTFVPQPAK